MCAGVPPSSASFLREHLCECMNRTNQDCREQSSPSSDNPQRHAMRAYSAAAAY